MNIFKIYDACIFIRFLEEISFKEVFEEWEKTLTYEQYTTTEILAEVQRDARIKLNDLIARDIIKILDPVPSDELTKINSLNPNLSEADCSIFFYVKRILDPICLTDEYPLRELCIENLVETHGTFGIYLKLKRDSTFPLDYIEKKFKKFEHNPRVFPST